MIPSFDTSLGAFSELTAFQLAIVWSHAILGSTAEILGAVSVVSWVRSSPSKMRCMRMKRWMMFLHKGYRSIIYFTIVSSTRKFTSEEIRQILEILNSFC